MCLCSKNCIQGHSLFLQFTCAPSAEQSVSFCRFTLRSRAISLSKKPSAISKGCKKRSVRCFPWPCSVQLKRTGDVSTMPVCSSATWSWPRGEQFCGEFYSLFGTIVLYLQARGEDVSKRITVNISERFNQIISQDRMR